MKKTMTLSAHSGESRNPVKSGAIPLSGSRLTVSIRPTPPGWTVLSAVLIMFAVLLAAIPKPAAAQELEGDYLYHFMTIRADRGKLENLLDWIAETKASGFFEEAGQTPPYVMRHSQGDQWDLMAVVPMGSWTEFHAEDRTARRQAAQQKYAEALAPGYALIAFSEDHFAYGPPPEEFASEFAENGFFHIEMFEAAAGKAGDLAEQRRMENAYLSATGGTANMIFRRAAGSNVDVFTIGFHEDLQAFAAMSDAGDDAKEAAAKDAGFKDRADISFLLRSLITGHHDTLAVKVE